MDSKHRVVPPAYWRSDDWGDYLYVGINSDEGCVMVLPRTVFSLQLKKIKESDKVNEKERRELARGFFGSFKRCSLDKQGRLALPKECVRDAGLKREIVLVGRGDLFEVWDQDKFSEEQKRAKASFMALCDKVGVL